MVVPKGGGRQSIDTKWCQVVHTGMPKRGHRHELALGSTHGCQRERGRLALGSTHKGAKGRGGGLSKDMNSRHVVHRGAKGGGRQSIGMNWCQVVHTSVLKGGGETARRHKLQPSSAHKGAKGRGDCA